jgi:hypothetical protein
MECRGASAGLPTACPIGVRTYIEGILSPPKDVFALYWSNATTNITTNAVAARSGYNAAIKAVINLWISVLNYALVSLR